MIIELTRNQAGEAIVEMARQLVAESATKIVLILPDPINENYQRDAKPKRSRRYPKLGMVAKVAGEVIFDDDD